ncbi:MAG: rRNA maturation RNase YbeY [Firmicutes bacterium]|nr:rRNA maturation RNase YbeY [Bacillota bacterium]
MKILCDTEGQQIPELEKMEEGAALCIREEGISPERAEVSLSFVTGEEIKELNHQYRGIDQVTDVLSFPQYADLNEIPQKGQLLLGDVVICTERARSQAEEFGHSLEREIVYLFIHSICHLLGYDHMEEEDRQQMRKKEETVMKQLELER